MKRILNSPWTIAIGGAIFSFLLSVGYDLFKGEKLFTTLNFIFVWVKETIITTLNFEIKLWWILVVAAVFLALYFTLTRENSVEVKNEPDFLSYTEDYFRLWKWSWSWKFNRSDYKWHITNLQAHCPQCDTPMIPDRFEDFFQCPRCRFQSSGLSHHEKAYEVEAIIIDNLDRKRKNGGQT